MTDRRVATSRLFSIALPLSFILIGSCLALSSAARENPKPEEIVLKHLEAIGPEESRSSVTSRIIVGTSRFSYRANGVGQTAGNAVLASDGSKSLIGMTFPESAYPYERLGFDGRKFTTGYIRPSIRTVLGDFLYSHSDIFEEGLIGGALNQAWPLLDVAARKPKLGYEGTRKVNGTEAYVLSYSPKNGADMKIRLYFDSATFQHLRSEYTLDIGPQMGTTDKTSVLQKSTRYQITEDFSDFKKESGLTLPHTYKLQLTIDNQGGVGQYSWTLTLAQYAFNRKIPTESFNVEAYKAGM